MPKFVGIISLKIATLYSVTLFFIGMVIRTEYSQMVFLFIMTTPIMTPLKLLDPSTNAFHVSYLFGVTTQVIDVRSAYVQCIMQ